MSSYVFDNLVDDEDVAYFTTVSYWGYIKYALFSLFLASAAWYLHTNWQLPAFVPVMLVTVSIGLTLLLKVLRDANELAVTSERVILKIGWLWQKSAILILSRVEGVEIDQSLLGRILNYGTVQVRGVGTEVFPVPYVIDPTEFRRQVFEGASAIKEAQVPADSPQPIIAPNQALAETARPYAPALPLSGADTVPD